jgi:hypothetical protein
VSRKEAQKAQKLDILAPFMAIRISPSATRLTRFAAKR